MSYLDDTCARLSAHFSSLRARRERDGRPTAGIYALEHPLSPAEVRQLEEALRIERELHPQLLADHALAWVVLATECGYAFSGQEYWPLLEARIPSWQYADRERLRLFFSCDFAESFRGAEPAGAWARHFSLISWPITHAILPKDLQVALSQSIYLARYYLLDVSTRDDIDVGETIELHACFSFGDRFARFLQQHALVGSLAKALLRAAEIDTWFDPATFSRIVTDLEAHAAAKYWLREARSHIAPKIRLAGASRAFHAAPTAAPLVSHVTPGLIFRRCGSHAWTLSLQPPSLIAAIRFEPSLAAALRVSRFSVRGTANQQYPGADLLVARPRERPLAAFPDAGHALLQFEAVDSPLTSLVERESILPLRKIWVFRIRPDGSAWLQASGILSPGSTYLLAMYGNAEDILPGTPQPCGLPSVVLTQFEVPSDLAAKDVNQFRALGLGFNRRTSVTAWGILPRRWNDGEAVEFVEGDPILLRVERDHVFDLLRCQVTGAQPILHPCASSNDVLLQLSDLPSGDLQVQIQTCSGTPQEYRAESTLLLQIRVRPPSAWQPKQIPHEALSIELTPPAPTLHDVLTSVTSVAIAGKLEEPVHVDLVLVQDGRETIHSVLHRKPPITGMEWHAGVRTVLKKDAICRDAMRADLAFLSVRSSRFGVHRTPLAVFPQPLRWKIGTDPEGHLVVRLHCDGEDVPTVTHTGFEAPYEAQSISYQEAASTIRAVDGLYVAQLRDELIDALVLTLPRKFRNLNALREINEEFVNWRLPVERLLKTYRLWAKGPAIGPLAEVRRRKLLDRVHHALIAVVAGAEWARLETHGSNSARVNFDAIAGWTDRWNLLEISVAEGDNRNFGIALGKYRHLREESELFDAYQRASRLFFAPGDTLVDVAWACAFNPARLPAAWLLPQGSDAAGFVPLVRGARLMKLGWDAAQESA